MIESGFNLIDSGDAKQDVGAGGGMPLLSKYEMDGSFSSTQSLVWPPGELWCSGWCVRAGGTGWFSQAKSERGNRAFVIEPLQKKKKKALSVRLACTCFALQRGKKVL